MTGCSECHSEDGFLFECTECGGQFCADHASLDDHDCPATDVSGEESAEERTESGRVDAELADDERIVDEDDAVPDEEATADDDAVPDDEATADDDAVPDDEGTTDEQDADTGTGDGSEPITLGAPDQEPTGSETSALTTEFPDESETTSDTIVAGPAENDSAEAAAAVSSGAAGSNDEAETGNSTTSAESHGDPASNPEVVTTNVVRSLARGVASGSALSEAIVRAMQPGGGVSRSSTAVEDDGSSPAAPAGSATASEDQAPSRPSSDEGGTTHAPRTERDRTRAERSTDGPAVAASSAAPAATATQTGAVERTASQAESATAGRPSVAERASRRARGTATRLVAGAADRAWYSVRTGSERLRAIPRRALDRAWSPIGDRVRSGGAHVERARATVRGAPRRISSTPSSRLAVASPRKLADGCSSAASTATARVRSVATGAIGDASGTTQRPAIVPGRRIAVLAVMVLTVALAVPFAGGLASSGLSIGTAFDGGNVGADGGGGPGLTPAAVNDSDVERAVFAEIEAVRDDAGSPPLAYDYRLAEIADSHGEDMAEHGYAAVESPDGETIEDRFEEYDCGRPGQAVQWLEPEDALDEDQLGAVLVENWLADEDHESFLTDDGFDRIGVGVSVADDGRVYVSLAACGG